MAIYAKAPSTIGVDYLTPGKLYLVREQSDDGESFFIQDDDGSGLFCLWEGCCHLDNLSWEKVEEEQADCCDNGKVWNNADPASGQWVPCERHGGEA